MANGAVIFFLSGLQKLLTTSSHSYSPYSYHHCHVIQCPHAFFNSFQPTSVLVLCTSGDYHHPTHHQQWVLTIWPVSITVPESHLEVLLSRATSYFFFEDFFNDCFINCKWKIKSTFSSLLPARCGQVAKLHPTGQGGECLKVPVTPLDGAASLPSPPPPSWGRASVRTAGS